VYRLTFADGGQTECCDEHLWLTTSRTARKHGHPAAVRTTAQLRETLYTGDGRPNHHLPWVRPVAFPARTLPLDPYLLGVYLGDGRTSGTTSVVVSNALHQGWLTSQ
jgi:replicative DNA helicase